MTGIFAAVPWGPFLFILLAGSLPTYFWRWLGVVLSGRLKEESEVLVWVKAVATALVAGVIAQLVIEPGGVLAETSIWVRVAAMAIGFAAFFLARRTVIVGVAAGAGSLMALMVLTGAPAPA